MLFFKIGSAVQSLHHSFGCFKLLIPNVIFILVAETAAAVGCSGTLCGISSSEPLPPKIQALRESTSCTLDNAKVEAIAPGSPNNPPNVKTVEQLLSESKFNEFFPSRNAAYTYSNFLRAIGKYPAICKTASNCPKILAGIFAHFQQETAGLFYLEEINKGTYCVGGCFTKRWQNFFGMSQRLSS